MCSFNNRSPSRYIIQENPKKAPSILPGICNNARQTDGDTAGGEGFYSRGKFDDYARHRFFVVSLSAELRSLCFGTGRWARCQIREPYRVQIRVAHYVSRFARAGCCESAILTNNLANLEMNGGVESRAKVSAFRGADLAIAIDECDKARGIDSSLGEA